MMTAERFELDIHWHPGRPRILVVGCSDGRLQEATDEFLNRALGIRQYDRLYIPGGAGALATNRCELMRPQQFRRECAFLVESHQVTHVLLLFHGPSADGPGQAVCADYQRVYPRANAAQIRTQQEADARELLSHRVEFAGTAQLSLYRLEVTAGHGVDVLTLFREDPDHPGVPAIEPRAVRERSATSRSP